MIGLVFRLNPANVRCVSRSASDAEFAQALERISQVSRRIALSLGELGVQALFQPGGFPI